MINTIKLFLLENKSVQTKINDYPFSYEGAYNIVAGDENATEFEIASVPNAYKNFTITVAMTNSRGQNVVAPPIVNNKFVLPVGMAIAGYGQIVLSAHGTNENGDNVTANFLPLKIKVANTALNWSSGVINGTIAIGRVVTLPPDSKAYAINVGTSTDAIIELGIPEGKGFVIDKTYSSIADMNAGFATDNVRLYGFAIIDTGNIEDIDNAKLFIKTETEYRYLTDLSGAQGIRGEQGVQGVGVLNIVPNGQDANGGNIYKITLTNGNTYNFVAPKGEKGDKGDDFGSDGTYPNMTVGNATSAEIAQRLHTSRYIDGVEFDGSAPITHFGVCTTSSSVADKTVALTRFGLVKGAVITVKFSYANEVNSPTLNVNNTGAHPIYADFYAQNLRWNNDAIMTLVYTSGQLGYGWFIISGYALAGKPVGSRWIQFSGESTPALRFGGTWVEDTTYAGRAFVGSGAGYTLGATGGEATHNHTSGNPTDADTSLHALIQYNYSNGDTVINETEGNYSAGWTPKQTVVTSGSRAYAGQQRAGAVKVVGNVSTESSMQPYKVITIWKRTA